MCTSPYYFHLHSLQSFFMLAGSAIWTAPNLPFERTTVWMAPNLPFERHCRLNGSHLPFERQPPRRRVFEGRRQQVRRIPKNAPSQPQISHSFAIELDRGSATYLICDYQRLHLAKAWNLSPNRLLRGSSPNSNLKTKLFANDHKNSFMIIILTLI